MNAMAQEGRASPSLDDQERYLEATGLDRTDPGSVDSKFTERESLEDERLQDLSAVTLDAREPESPDTDIGLVPDTLEENAPLAQSLDPNAIGSESSSSKFPETQRLYPGMHQEYARQRAQQHAQQQQQQQHVSGEGRRKSIDRHEKEITALEEVKTLSTEYTLLWVPQCQQYLSGPPEDVKVKESEYAQLRNSLVEACILLQAHTVELEGNERARQETTELGEKVQDMILKLEASVGVKVADRVPSISDPEDTEQPASPTEEDTIFLEHPGAYRCDLCPKRFTHPHDLRSHLRSHTDELLPIQQQQQSVEDPSQDPQLLPVALLAMYPELSNFDGSALAQSDHDSDKDHGRTVTGGEASGSSSRGGIPLHDTQPDPNLSHERREQIDTFERQTASSLQSPGASWGSNLEEFSDKEEVLIDTYYCCQCHRRRQQSHERCDCGHSRCPDCQASLYVCTCCPKQPKKFANAEELRCVSIPIINFVSFSFPAPMHIRVAFGRP